jgi:NAD(P)-dependent dehydrogenase (short-subunit alcohol dehydrogenase family)
MPTVLITGANRGLGLEFARQYSTDGWSVIAAARKSSPELEVLGISFERLDMEDLEATSRFGDRLEKLDLLVANAGTYGPEEVDDWEAARDWLQTFTVNTVAPYLLARSVLRLFDRSRGKLIAITSRMGSIEDNSSGGYLAYRTSKTALNSAWHNLALDLSASGIVAAVLHPGWVKTRMGGSSAPLSPEQSVSALRQVIEGLGPKDSGGFFSYDGSKLPW